MTARLENGVKSVVGSINGADFRAGDWGIMTCLRNKYRVANLSLIMK